MTKFFILAWMVLKKKTYTLFKLQSSLEMVFYALHSCVLCVSTVLPILTCMRLVWFQSSCICKYRPNCSITRPHHASHENAREGL